VTHLPSLSPYVIGAAIHRATAELMSRLYERMLREGETPAAALRGAQIFVLRTKGLDVRYCRDAFTLQGKWR
jgi:CHAT domain-containing protein